MTRTRAVGRGGGRRAPSRAALVPAAAVATLVALLIVVAAACGPATPSAPAGSPAGSSIAPASPGTEGSAGSGARPTPWLGNAVLGLEPLGIADGQIGAAMTDMSKGIAEENLSLMREAADGLAGLDVLLSNVALVRQYPPMASFADRYEAAITKVDTEATKLRDAIDAGDGPAITASTQGLLAGMADYTALQPELADWIRQMPEQKKMLVL
jgi:hypothetical protein